MACDWESQFKTWAAPPSATETEKMERAEKAIRDAIRKSEKLQAHDVHVYPQGSYYNRTNVPGESDVDIRVEVDDVFWPDWSFVDSDAHSDKTVWDRLAGEAGLSSVRYTFPEFTPAHRPARVRT